MYKNLIELFKENEGKGAVGAFNVHCLEMVPSMVHGAEELDGAVLGAVGLEALEDLRAVVEHGGAGVDAEVVQGDDFRVVPAALRVVVHGEHVVGEYRAEAQLGGVGGLGAGGGGAGNLDIHCLSLPCFPIFPVRHGLSVDDRDVPFYYRPVHRP